MLELAFGYNGTERLFGQTTGLAKGDMNAAGGGNMQNQDNMQAPNGNGSSFSQNGNQSFGNHSQAPQPPNGQPALSMEAEAHLPQVATDLEMEGLAAEAEKA